MNDGVIKTMVDRFLSWRLPKNFNPDGGITFRHNHHEPTGTNLLDATQADEMVRHMVEGIVEGVTIVYSGKNVLAGYMDGKQFSEFTIAPNTAMPFPPGARIVLAEYATGARVVEAPAPIPMRLTCPICSALHVDEGEFATKPHHTHSCQACGMTWRPAVVCTVGVRFLPGFTLGRNEI